MMELGGSSYTHRDASCALLKAACSQQHNNTDKKTCETTYTLMSPRH